MAVWQCGCFERVKAGTHAAACALAVLMAGYNALAWVMRRERHLAVNTISYVLAACWEVKQTKHHLDRGSPGRHAQRHVGDSHASRPRHHALRRVRSVAA